MPKVFCKLGTIDPRPVLRDVRVDRKGYLSMFSFQLDGMGHRMEFMGRGQDAVFVLPVNWERRVLYLVEQNRCITIMSSARGRSMQAYLRDNPDQRANFPVLVDHLACTLDSPAGMIDGNETPEAAGVREVQEETGFIIGTESLEHVQSHWNSSGCTDERHFTYLATVTDATPHEQPVGDGTENIVTWEYTFEEAFALLDDKKVNHATFGVLLWALRARDLQRQLEREVANRLRATEALNALEEQLKP